MEKAQAQGGPYEDAKAFASKTAEHAARIAGVLTTFAEPEAMSIDGETMARAVSLASFYAEEVTRLQNAAVIPPEVQQAERMKDWLLTKWREEFISAAIAAQHSPIRNTPNCRKALFFLEVYGWLVKANGSEVEGKMRKEAWRIVRTAK